MPKGATVPPRLVPLALLALLLPQLGGCGAYGLFSFPPQPRGQQVDPTDVTQLVPGTSTRKDVQALLGTPTMTASFDPNTWLYVSQITRPVIAGTLGVRSQHVYALTFDTAGVLRKISFKDRADALPVQVVSRTTPTPGNNASIMQQLIGNIGRFNPAGATTPLTPSSANTPGNY
jgi:outer membrane protein assembly factor BamE (lipoprotein component of BamABCDE complex)